MAELKIGLLVKLSSSMFNLNILELNIHRWSSMKLESKKAVRATILFIIINHFCGLHIVDVVGKVETISNNTVAIPLFLFNGFSNFFGVTESLSLFL